jgi:hypothetical protein
LSIKLRGLLEIRQNRRAADLDHAAVEANVSIRIPFPARMNLEAAVHDIHAQRQQIGAWPGKQLNLVTRR